MDQDVTLVLLAAGASSRMRGADKLLETVSDEPLLRLMARRAAKAGPLRVVLPQGHSARRAVLDGIEAEIVETAPGGTMSDSLAAGVAGLTGPVLIVLADMPEVTAHDLHLLIALSRQAPNAILRAAGQDGTAGNPVLFPADLLAELGKIRGDKGARGVLKNHAGRVHLVPLPGDHAVIDLDTPEDWAAWRNSL
ncbi:nucleotidyltransferase family protein [Nioella nitratireducens]|uniref:nucleotidyltransferase family protein n=1 Tax=Nioella nitratireducens TaxID=1287720 RepID=UPI0008FD7004|nr:nucleotidyltransferase family protein [Nioella nitratireducens]